MFIPPTTDSREMTKRQQQPARRHFKPTLYAIRGPAAPQATTAVVVKKMLHVLDDEEKKLFPKEVALLHDLKHKYIVAYFQCTIDTQEVYCFGPLFKASLQIVSGSQISTLMIVVFVCLTDYSLQMVVIRLCRNFRDCFGAGLSFRNYEN